MFKTSAAALVAVGLGACSSVNPFISHISHPDRGWPIDDRKEWALDIVGVEGEANLGNVSLIASTGYVYTPNETQRWITEFTVKYNFKFARE